MSTGYTNKRKWSAMTDSTKLLKKLLSSKQLAGISTSEVNTVEDLKNVLDAVVDPPQTLTEFRASLDSTPYQRLLNHLGRMLPSFIYFSHYNTLPGSVSIRRLQSVEEGDLDPGERTALSLLRLAGVESEEFDEANYEARKAALEAAANTLTDEVFEYWTQNTELQVELDIEFRPVERTPPHPTPPPEPYLQIRIRNNRHRVTLNFAERSAGFVWFFSFLAFFSEYRSAGNQHVLLLDEPGLNLHGTAQSDLLRYIDEQLAEEHQVIYTTHSPFMVQPNHLERARLVEDQDGVGTVVSDDALGTTSETQFPLHAAIGIQVTQTLFIGSSTLIVEGNADLLYIQAMTEVLTDAGREGLDERWTVLPVGGLDKMPTFLSLLSPQVRAIALHDVPRVSPQKLDDLVDDGVISADQLLPVTEFLPSDEGDTEDLFSTSTYLAILKRSDVVTISKSRLKGGKRIVARINRATGEEFSHYAPARYLASHLDSLAEAIDQESMDRFESLFRALNQRLG
ncbi:MAG: AAA family ATPase [Microthrixaceae bacterium]